MSLFDELQMQDQRTIRTLNRKRTTENSKKKSYIVEAKNIDVIETFVLDFYIKPRLK